MTKRLTSSLTGAVLFIVIINLLGRGLGFFREILFANYFGMGVNFDIYLVGAVLPITINTMILYIGQNYFIPTYNKIKVTDENASQRFFNLTLILFGISSLLLAVILYAFAHPIIEVYLDTNDFELCNKALIIFEIFLITVPLSSIISILIAYHQAEYEFRYPAFSQILLNVAIIPILFIFTDKLGVYTIPIGFIGGNLLQVFYLVFKSKNHFSLDTIRHIKLNDYKHVLDFTIVSVVIIETIGQFYIIADRYFFNSVSAGGISSLNYAVNIFVLPITIYTYAVATVILPKFSKSIQSANIRELSKNQTDAIRINLFIFIPVTFLYIFYGDQLIRIIFERGMFTLEDSQLTFNVLRLYSISLVFYSTYAIYNKIIYGARLVNQLLAITIIGIAIKIILNFVLVEKYQQNGLALSSAVSYIYFFLASIILISSKLKGLSHSIFFKELSFYLVNVIISYLLVEIIFSNFDQLESPYSLIKFLVFCVFLFMNLKLVSHGSIQLLIGLMKNLRNVKTL